MSRNGQSNGTRRPRNAASEPPPNLLEQGRRIVILLERQGRIEGDTVASVCRMLADEGPLVRDLTEGLLESSAEAA